MMSAKRGIIKPSFLSYGLTLLALAGISILMLMPLPHAAEEDVFERHLRNLLHVPLFTVLMILMRFLQTSFPVKWSSLWLCALAVFLIGAIFEVVQSFTGRSCSLNDLISNLGGILIACAILHRSSQRCDGKLRLVSLLVGLGILGSVMQPLVNEMLAARAKRANFPELLDLEYPKGLWQAQGGTRLKVVKGGGVGSVKGLEVLIAAGTYEGLRYVVPWGMDVVDYSGLVIEVDNPGEKFELGVRLDGEESLRQYRSITVPTGRSMLQTEWVSTVDGGNLTRVVLFTGEQQPARKFLLLSARLIGKFQKTAPAEP